LGHGAEVSVATPAPAPRRAFWAALGIVFAVALVLRVVCVAQYEAGHPLSARPVIDEESYDRWAREIAGGEVVGREIFFQEPLYPYALAGVYALAGDDPEAQRSAARHAQAVLGALTAVLAGLLGAKLFGARAGIVAGALMALHRPAVWFPALLLKENLFLPLACAFALALISARSWRGWLGAGALAALGALLRGNMLVLLPFFAAWAALRAWRDREGAARAAGCASAVLAGAALVLLPVAARNHHVGGRFVLTTSGAGTNVYGGNNLDNPYGLAKEFDWVRGIPEHEAGDWRREASRRAGRELDASETSSFWLRETLRSVRDEPAEHARILWRKLRLTLGGYEVPDNHFLEWDARYVPILRAPLPGFPVDGTIAMCGAFAFAALWALRRGEALANRPARSVLAFAAAYLVTVVLTVTSERVRLPLVPLLSPFAAFALARVVRKSSWPVLIPSAALAALAVLAPALPAEMRERDFDERDHNLAVRALSEGDLAEARPIVSGLVQRRGGSARVQLVAAELDYRSAREKLDAPETPASGRETAAKEIESALTALAGVAKRGNAQERYRANVLSGAIRQYLGQWTDAEAAYRAALAFDAEDRDLRRRLAVVVAERAMSAPSETREEGLREAIAMLEALQRERSEAEIEQLLARMRSRL
jgi:4-amino-4-deoxy-L-arabinose transferase-like glycosyltransferase